MRLPRLRLLALVAALALGAAACGGGGGGGDSSDEAGPFTAPTLGGGELASSSFDGQDTVLWFWAPWCTTCRGEADDVVASAAALEGSVEIIGVAGRGDVPEMEDFLSDTGTGDLTHVVDADGAIWSDYGVASQPAYAFIDDSGDVEVVLGALGADGLTERMQALADA
ncbi:MAG: redoxin domain-containing protein [Acidimicrobiales bacterium]|nr:redoxin domain-containing protein [Acidimicrobiales bacterium]